MTVIDCVHLRVDFSLSLCFVDDFESHTSGGEALNTANGRTHACFHNAVVLLSTFMFDMLLLLPDFEWCIVVQIP